MRKSSAKPVTVKEEPLSTPDEGHYTPGSPLLEQRLMDGFEDARNRNEAVSSPPLFDDSSPLQPADTLDSPKTTSNEFM